MRAKCLLLALISACPVVSADAQQNLPSPPIRSRNVLIIGGHSQDLVLGRLEQGRRYRVRAILLGRTSPAADRVQIRMSGVADRWEELLGPHELLLNKGFTPDSRAAVRLTCTGMGELDSLHRVRVEWLAEPETRMAMVDYIPSPNQSLRSAAAVLNTIVVHATVTPTTEATVDWFLTPRSQVSAHYVVGRDGRIVQMVDDTARAWHAGVSELEGVKGVNDFSIGIEIVNLNDGRDPYTDSQYRSVAAIVRHIREQYDVPDSRIVSHENVARPQGRRNDPRGFDFARLLRLSRNPR